MKKIIDWVIHKPKVMIWITAVCVIFALSQFPKIKIDTDPENMLSQDAPARVFHREMKKEFGKDLCFWGGGIDVQQVLPFASLDEIEEDVRHTIEIMAPRGGYVFFPSHNVQADVTPDRFHGTFETALKYRDYPIGTG